MISRRILIGATVGILLTAASVAGRAPRQALFIDGYATAPRIGGDFPHEITRDGARRFLAAVGGDQDTYGFALYRFRAGGPLDRTFARRGVVAPQFAKRITAGAEGIGVQRKGRIVLGGWRRDRVGSGLLLVRYKPNGDLDPSFGRGGWVKPNLKPGGRKIRGLALQPNDRIVVVGAVNERPGEGRPTAFVARYRANGALDRTFGRLGHVLLPAPRRESYTGLDNVEVLGSGKLLVSGYRQGNLFLARLTPNGRLDPGFGGGDGKVATRLEGNRFCEVLACRPNSSMTRDRQGRILVQGETAADQRLVLARYRSQGRLDRTFAAKGLVRARVGAVMSTRGVAVHQSNDIVVTAFSRRVPNGPARFTVLRFQPDGGRDTLWAKHGVRFYFGDAHGAATTALRLGSGVLVGGGFRRPAGNGFDYFIALRLIR